MAVYLRRYFVEGIVFAAILIDARVALGNTRSGSLGMDDRHHVEESSMTSQVFCIYPSSINDKGVSNDLAIFVFKFALSWVVVEQTRRVVSIELPYFRRNLPNGTTLRFDNQNLPLFRKPIAIRTNHRFGVNWQRI
jgi:hypothetical protein